MGSRKVDRGAGDLDRPDPHLLHSNSEFISGKTNGEFHLTRGISLNLVADHDISFTTKPNEHSPQTGIHNGSLLYTGKHVVTSQDYHSLNGEPRLPTSEGTQLGGSGNKYCYVYDPIIARAYTKKYNIDPTENMSSSELHRGHLHQDETMIKYLPASKNFTPSPATLPIEIDSVGNSTDMQFHTGKIVKIAY